ncbi:GE37468 family thiazolyl peptide [Amycolatopsis sp. A1MSW2902]|uniref:thiomuracin/GE37468 family thiazolyl RiPP peptide n=1 Tax=Amycolatopsis sp. A1MSW2902 TaxID=687413 RepID=UPI00307DDAB8
MNKVTTEFDDLPLDVFDLIDSESSVESLTSGHGLTEIGASTCYGQSNCCSFCCCAGCGS